jgi:hypothetical protein
LQGDRAHNKLSKKYMMIFSSLFIVRFCILNINLLCNMLAYQNNCKNSYCIFNICYDVPNHLAKCLLEALPLCGVETKREILVKG